MYSIVEVLRKEEESSAVVAASFVGRVLACAFAGSVAESGRGRVTPEAARLKHST